MRSLSFARALFLSLSVYVSECVCQRGCIYACACIRVDFVCIGLCELMEGTGEKLPQQRVRFDLFFALNLALRTICASTQYDYLNINKVKKKKHKCPASIGDER